MPGWKRRGWRKADGKPVLNQDLLKALDEELRAATSASSGFAGTRVMR